MPPVVHAFYIAAFSWVFFSSVRNGQTLMDKGLAFGTYAAIMGIPFF